MAKYIVMKSKYRHARDQCDELTMEYDMLMEALAKEQQDKELLLDRVLGEYFGQ